MNREYIVLDSGVIYYEENGRRISFLPDPANSDYQAYLEHSTENPTEDVE